MKCLKLRALFVFPLFSSLFLASCGGGGTDNNANNVSNASSPSASVNKTGTSTIHPTSVSKTNAISAIKPAGSVVTTKEVPPPQAELNFCSYNTCSSSSVITETYLKTGPNTHLNRTVYLYNNAASRANILKIQSTDQSDLAITNNCTSYLDSGKYCSVSFSYNPTQYSTNPTQPSPASVIVTYSISDAGVKSLTLNAPYVCAAPNLITVASPDDLTTTIQELDMDLNPNLYPSINGSTIVTTSNSTGWNPGNTMPHSLNGTAYIVNTGNDAALVSWPTTTSIPNLNVQVNEGCQSSNSSAYQLQAGSYCSLTYTYNPSVIPSDIVTNASKYIQTSNVNYTDSESINSYTASLKVAAYSTTNTVFSTMPDRLYYNETGNPEFNQQMYNTTILSDDTGLSPMYLTIPWIYYSDYVQAGSLHNYFYVYNINNPSNITNNFVIFPQVNGLTLSASSGKFDYDSTSWGCDFTHHVSCWQPIAYSSQQSPTCLGNSCMTNLQFTNTSSTSNNILISLPIKYVPQNQAPGALFVNYLSGLNAGYILTGKASDRVFGIINNSANSFCVVNPGTTQAISNNNGNQINLTYPLTYAQNETITMNYYNSACTTPAPSQTSSASFEYVSY